VGKANGSFRVCVVVSHGATYPAPSRLQQQETRNEPFPARAGRYAAIVTA
jgi:hypothetical protein